MSMNLYNTNYYKTIVQAINVAMEEKKKNKAISDERYVL